MLHFDNHYINQMKCIVFQCKMSEKNLALNIDNILQQKGLHSLRNTYENPREIEL